MWKRDPSRDASSIVQCARMLILPGILRPGTWLTDLPYLGPTEAFLVTACGYFGSAELCVPRSGQLDG